MKRLATPSFIVTLLANLILGNAILGMLFFDKEGSFVFLACVFNPVAVVILLFAFSRVKATWKAWRVVLWAVLATVSVPALAAAAFVALEGLASPWRTIMYAIMFAVFGILIGGPFAVPFLPVNILGLFLFRRHLQRKAFFEKTACDTAEHQKLRA